MTRLKFIQTVENALIKYYISGMSDSISRNSHLTGLEKDVYISDNIVQAALIDIINNIATYQGIDYGMDAKSFKKLVEKEEMIIESKIIIKDKPDNVVELKL